MINASGTEVNITENTEVGITADSTAPIADFVTDNYKCGNGNTVQSVTQNGFHGSINKAGKCLFQVRLFQLWL